MGCMGFLKGLKENNRKIIISIITSNFKLHPNRLNTLDIHFMRKKVFLRSANVLSPILSTLYL